MVLHHRFCSWLSTASSSQYTAHTPLNSVYPSYYDFPLVLNSMQTKKIKTMWGLVRLVPIVFLVSSLVAQPNIAYITTKVEEQPVNKVALDIDEPKQ